MARYLCQGTGLCQVLDVVLHMDMYNSAANHE